MTIITLDPESIPEVPFPSPGVRLDAVRPNVTSKYEGIKDALSEGLPDNGRYVFVNDPEPGVSWRSRLASWAKTHGVTIRQRRMDGTEVGQPEGMGYLLRAVPRDPSTSRPRRPRSHKKGGRKHG